MFSVTEISMKEHIESIETRRLINSEYQRGFMEGHQSAIKEVAECLDTLMRRHDHVAIGEDFIIPD